MKKISLLLILVFVYSYAHAQNDEKIIDSIRNAYHIPGLAYAVVKPQHTLIGVSGYLKAGDSSRVTAESDFSLGSCSKSVTALLAGELVRQGKLTWNTPFFSIFPELKPLSRKAYYGITLESLLSHRANLVPLTGQYKESIPESLIRDTTLGCRDRLGRWILKQKPWHKDKVYNYSNAGYVLAGLMIEKVTGKSWESLLQEMLKKWEIKPLFRFPNELDIHNTWFHEEENHPVGPERNSESGCTKAIAPAGMVFLNIKEMAAYLSEHLRGRMGTSNFLPQEIYDKIHFGLPQYALGWMWIEKEGQRILAHQGNSAGWSFCEMRIYEKEQIALVVFSNIGTEKAMEGMSLIRKLLYENARNKQN